ncbi:MAG: WbqC family protein [Raineya sp.]
MSIVIELQYFPCLAYFCSFLEAHEVFLDIFEHYEKQSYRNRCKILTATKIQSLSVPIKHTAQKQILRDTRIDYHENWVDIHWRSIASAYGKAPFFEFYADTFKNILYKRPVFLADLNIEILTACLKYLYIQTPIQYSEKYIDTQYWTHLRDLRSQIHPKKEELIKKYYTPKPYQQVFGNKFEANLSILDLLFCEGNKSLAILKQSSKNKAD